MSDDLEKGGRGGMTRRALLRSLVAVRHRIAHLFGWNLGRVETWWDGDVLMVGFKCSDCGKIEGAHESVTNKIRRLGD